MRAITSFCHRDFYGWKRPADAEYSSRFSDTFHLEPPAFLTRYIRKARNTTRLVLPLFLGTVTIFIPCGITL